ncbi:MAG: hypothetical protein R2798_06880 [Chitinophagales bacterium]
MTVYASRKHNNNLCFATAAINLTRNALPICSASNSGIICVGQSLSLMKQAVML